MILINQHCFHEADETKASKKKKKEDLTQSYDKNPYTIPYHTHTIENSRTNGQHKDATKNFDYKTLQTDLRRSV